MFIGYKQYWENVNFSTAIQDIRLKFLCTNLYWINMKLPCKREPNQSHKIFSCRQTKPH